MSLTSADHLEIVRRHYPQAISTVTAVDRLFDLLARRYELTPDQVMAADSLCCDDVNTIEYPPRAYEMLGPFKMGGLNGFPFAGLTGMGAFAAHVPDDGAVFVYHAPHIGISKDGSVGTIMRKASTRPADAAAPVGRHSRACRRVTSRPARSRTSITSSTRSSRSSSPSAIGCSGRPTRCSRRRR